MCRMSKICTKYFDFGRSCKTDIILVVSLFVFVFFVYEALHGTEIIS